MTEKTLTLDERIEEITLAAIEKAAGQRIEQRDLMQEIGKTLTKADASWLIEMELSRIIDEVLEEDGRYTEWVAMTDGKTFERWYAPQRERGRRADD